MIYITESTVYTNEFEPHLKAVDLPQQQQVAEQTLAARGPRVVVSANGGAADCVLIFIQLIIQLDEHVRPAYQDDG